MARAWKKFYANQQQLCDKHYRLKDRLRLFDAVVTATALYGSGCWTMTAAREAKLRSTQTKMLRKVLGLRRRKAAAREERGEEDSASASEANGEGTEEGGEDADEDEEDGDEDSGESWIEWMRRTTGVMRDCANQGKVSDWVTEQRRRKWRWAGHVARRTDGRWTTWMLDWQPPGGRRAPGRPVARWEDAIVSFMQGRGRWAAVAQDRDCWSGLEDEFSRGSADLVVA